jgi:hypothetical protein
LNSQGDALAIEDKLTPEDHERIMDLLKTQRDVSSGIDKTVEAAADDDDLYDQMLASVDRFREEVNRAVKTMEQMLRRHR